MGDFKSDQIPLVTVLGTAPTQPDCRPVVPRTDALHKQVNVGILFPQLIICNERENQII